MSTADIARGYLRRGWCPIPVQFKSKKPNTPDWRHMRLREDDLEGAFSGKINIGVVLGPPSNGLTDVDLDCREAIAIAPFMLPRTGAIFGRHSAPPPKEGRNIVIDYQWMAQRQAQYQDVAREISAGHGRGLTPEYRRPT